MLNTRLSPPKTPSAGHGSKRITTRRCTLALATALTALLMSACGASHKLQAQLAPMTIEGSTPTTGPLTTNHFRRDKVAAVSEDKIREILSAPVFLEAKSRLGIVQVVDRYLADHALPLVRVPGVLEERLTQANLFEAVTEVSTDWPAQTSIAGLRELATRYRAEYLLLYRHRFQHRSHLNAWALTYLTLVGAFVAPANTVETAGVVEATLFDVKSGTLLFTVFERVYATTEENIWQNDRKRSDRMTELLNEATERLAGAVEGEFADLVAARDRWTESQISSRAVQP